MPESAIGLICWLRYIVDVRVRMDVPGEYNQTSIRFSVSSLPGNRSTAKPRVFIPHV